MEFEKVICQCGAINKKPVDRESKCGKCKTPFQDWQIVDYEWYSPLFEKTLTEEEIRMALEKNTAPGRDL